jgi:tripartite-type tricarboxylate transporter receptor subunit TctC
MEAFKAATGTYMVHIPYRGATQAALDVISNQVQVHFSAVSIVQPFITSGRVRALGVPSAKRSAALPDVPTFEESGLAGFDVTSWVGIFAPAKTPPAVIERLHKELAVVLRTPFVKERYGVLGIEPVGNTPRAFFEQVREDLARWKKVVAAANIKVE